MHYAGKKEFYLHLGGGNFVFSHFPVIFFFLQNIDSHLKKKKKDSHSVSFRSFYLWLLYFTKFLYGLKFLKYD